MFFVTVRGSFDEKARAGLREAKRLLPEIASDAQNLAQKIARYNELSGTHEISGPLELLSLLDLIQNTANAGAQYERVFDVDIRYIRRQFGEWYPLEEMPMPAAMIKQISEAASEHEPACRLEYSSHVTDQKEGIIPAFYKLIQSGELPSMMVAGRRLVPDSSIDEILTAKLESSAA